MIRITRAAIFLTIFTCTLIAASQEQQQQSDQQPSQPQQAPHHTNAHTRAASQQKEDDSTPQAPENPRADVIRENNFGVSLMNRQQFEKALGKFQRACILDPQTDIG